MRYKIEVYLWTEGAWKGNCSRYFVKGIYGRNICLTGIDNAKIYQSKEKAEIAKALVMKKYPSAVVELYEVN